jgi:hypothetical protein
MINYEFATTDIINFNDFYKILVKKLIFIQSLELLGLLNQGNVEIITIKPIFFANYIFCLIILCIIKDNFTFD